MAAAVPAPPPADTPCALCRRPLGRRTEWHHLVPKSEGGRDTVPLHPICHRAIHAGATNAELARDYPTLDALRMREDIVRFLAWVAGKHANFHAPTRRGRG
ncbi:HNH endonuclease [Sphingomonas canadensis]|nr:HNH endonuclease [Sphingomonas canadensis]MCW3835286.1 HNH endonuclease [Sphingomonas canadensis]